MARARGASAPSFLKFVAIRFSRWIRTLTQLCHCVSGRRDRGGCHCTVAASTAFDDPRSRLLELRPLRRFTSHLTYSFHQLHYHVRWILLQPRPAAEPGLCVPGSNAWEPPLTIPVPQTEVLSSHRRRTEIRANSSTTRPSRASSSGDRRRVSTLLSRVTAKAVTPSSSSTGSSLRW